MPPLIGSGFAVKRCAICLHFNMDGIFWGERYFEIIFVGLSAERVLHNGVL